MVVAVIGCGRIANAAHFKALEQMDNVRIKYACDIEIAKAEISKEKFPKIENITKDYKAVLTDEEVDAVFVLTPNLEHYKITMDALKAGKHVFCEKPITINYELSKEMKDFADKQEKILNIGVCNRFNKSVEMLADMVKNNEFGDLYHVYCSFRSFRSIPGLGGPFTTKELSGGGVLIDWGIHFFDLVLYVLGEPCIKNVSCDAYSKLGKDMKNYKFEHMWARDTKNTENGIYNVEDFVSGYIRTDKASISFNGAWAENNINENEMFIDFMGDKCGARLDYCKKFKICKNDTLEVVEPEYDIPDMYFCEDKAFLESAASGVKNKGNIDHVLESTKLLDVLYASSERKGEIQM